ncbi:MAG: class I SAM-dependent methyltransferase [Anaerolineaceae bacterium]|nr:class I SAM-dependent methyltransferase [Anaerolineaceae bacterium]
MNIKPQYNKALQQTQYKTAQNLNARIRLHQRYSTSSQTWDEFVFSQMHLKTGQNVLELGCGNASQTRSNRALFPRDIHYFMTDFSWGMMQEAITALNADPRFAFSVQDAQAVAFPLQSFDLVTANHMLYHVPDILLALKGIWRLLKPNGRLMAATNGSGHMADLDSLIAAYNPAFQNMHAFHTAFTLENGKDLIASIFGSCTLVPYHSDLWVTSAKDLTDYVLSMDKMNGTARSMDPQSLTAFFQSCIDKEGGIKIRKSTGLLMAIKEETGRPILADKPQKQQ